MPVQFQFLQDRSDLVLVAAVALLPADGTALGIYARSGRRSARGCSCCTQC